MSEFIGEGEGNSAKIAEFIGKETSRRLGSLAGSLKIPADKLSAIAGDFGGRAIMMHARLFPKAKPGKKQTAAKMAAVIDRSERHVRRLLADARKLLG